MSKNQVFSLSDFKEFTLESVNRLKELDDRDEAVSYCEARIKELLKSDHSHILYYDKQQKHYTVPRLQKSQKLCPEISSVFTEVISKKQPLLLTELENSLLYQEQCDNLLEEEIGALVLVPAMIDKSSPNPPDMLVWCASTKQNSHSFSQKSVLYLMKYLEAIKPMLLKFEHEEEIDYHEVSLKECIDNNEQLEYKIRRNEQYFHSIIHDIRTPMNALMGFLQLITENEKDETRLEYLDMAQKSGDQMIRLISDALDMAKIESGNLALDKKYFHPLDEFKDTVKIFYETARKRDIILGAYIDPSLPKQIKSDAYRIKQVLSNLLSNAIKFTPEQGNILVEILYDEKQDTVTFSVQDSGIGISEEEQKNIFLPYRQETKSTEGKYGGTGLGLSISQQITVLLGGKLSVESRIGEGSRFYFTIPANTPEESQPSLDIARLHEYDMVLYKWSKQNDLRRKVLKRYLKSFRQKVTSTKNKATIEAYLDDKSSCDILVVGGWYLNEEDHSLIQKLLDETDITVWYVEDTFEEGIHRLSGNVHKVTLPILGQELFHVLTEGKAKSLQEKSERTESLLFTGKRVLVVDDNRINLKFMKEVLGRFGLECALYDDPVKALEAMNKEQFDMVFMDENMPKMQGSDAIKQIREMEREKGLSPSALISLSGDTEHEEKILRSGADKVLTKPVQLNVLTEVFKEYLKAS